MADVWDSGECFEVPDISLTDIPKRRWLVSQKRNRNLFDLTTLWKKTILLQREKLIAQGEPLPVNAPTEDEETLERIEFDRQMPHSQMRDKPTWGDLEYIHLDI